MMQRKLGLSKAGYGGITEMYSKGKLSANEARNIADKIHEIAIGNSETHGDEKTSLQGILDEAKNNMSKGDVEGLKKILGVYFTVDTIKSAFTSISQKQNSGEIKKALQSHFLITDDAAGKITDKINVLSEKNKDEFEEIIKSDEFAERIHELVGFVGRFDEKDFLQAVDEASIQRIVNEFCRSASEILMTDSR